MMNNLFTFHPEIATGLLSGKLEQVFHNDIPVGQVRDAITGRFVENGMAIGLQSSPISLVPNLGQVSQIVGLLQATTAIIGVGIAANIGISAVGLYQTMKLRKDVKLMRSEIKDGFLDLKTILKDQGQEILEHIDQVAEDVEFRNHRTILSRAYAEFSQAVERLQTALTIEDPAIRNGDIQSVRQMMTEALKDYENPELLQSINAAGYIRRRECVWAIRQAIAQSFQLQGEYASSSHELEKLEKLIRQDTSNAVSMISSEAELDFLFPEITHIHTHDLAALKLWQAQLTWFQELPAEEVKQLSASGLTLFALTDSQSTQIVEVPAAQTQYETYKTKSHYIALKDQLRLFVEPNLRFEYTRTVAQKAQTQKLQALTSDNLNQASDFTIANLYHYLQPVAH
jgi:hypothetical protein